MTSQAGSEPPDTSRVDETTAPEVDEAVVRPDRPDMKRADPPRSQVMTRPRLLDRALTLFRIGIGFGGVAVLSGVIWRRDAHESLLALMTDLDGSAANKAALANAVIYSALVVMAIFLIVELIMLSRLSHGRGWVRWFLLGWVPVNIAVLAFAQEIISGDRWHALVIQLFLVIQAVASVGALLMTFAPPVRQWLKQSRRPRKNS